MSDVVERLRAVAAMDLRTGGFLAHTLDTAAEAAVLIERLQVALNAKPVLTDAQREQLLTGYGAILSAESVFELGWLIALGNARRFSGMES